MQIFDHLQRKDNVSLPSGNVISKNDGQQIAETNTAGMNPSPMNTVLQMKPEIQKEGDEPFLSGLVVFENCENQMDNFFMIPEEQGNPGFHPSTSRVGNIDGFWFKFHTPKSQWWKIPAIATTFVTCNEEDERSPHIRPAAIVPFFTSGWSDDGIHVANPY